MSTFGRRNLLLAAEGLLRLIVDRHLSTLLPFPGFVVLKPIKNVLTLDLAIKAQLSGDLLNLVSARSPKPGPEQVGQNFNLFGGRVPPPALCTTAAAVATAVAASNPGGFDVKP